MYGLRVYGIQPYGAHLFDGREVYGNTDRTIKVQSFMSFGPQVGVKTRVTNAVGGVITGRTSPTGNLSGGTYVPPPPPGSVPVGATGFSADIGSSTRLRGTLSGGRAVIYLAGRINGRTNERVTLSGGSVKAITYLFGQPISTGTSIYSVLEGGDPAIILTGTTAVAGTLSGGVVTKVVPLQGYPIVMAPRISATLSGGRATIALAANSFGATVILGTLNPGTTRPVRVSLTGRVYTQPVVTGTITGGHPYIPPTTPPVSTTGKVVFAGDVSMMAAFQVRFVSPPTVTSAPPPPGGPTDLPTGLDGSTVVSNPLVELLESIGYGVNGPASERIIVPPHPVHLCGEDTHSPVTALEAPIQANSDGTPSYSYERWVRVRFVPPFGLVSAFRFWVDMTDPIPDGWQIYWGWTNGYQVPTASQSEVAVSSLPLADPGPLMPNLGEGVVLSGESVKYTPYVVIQAFYVPPMVSEGSYIEPLPGFTYNIGYLQA